jgi:tetratricopeptide (TPR) repeat protein
LLVWPARLSADYSYNEIPVAIDVKAIAACVVCVAAVGLGIRAWRRHRELSFAILFFFVTLAPVSNVFLLIGSIMGERFLYLPSVGFFAAVVFGARLAWERAPRLRRPLAAALAIVLVALAVRAYARNLDWLEERRFWRSAVEAAPGSYRARISEAAATPVDRRADRERVAAEVAGVLATLDPLPDSRNTAVPYRNAGVIYRNLGDELTLNRAEPDGTEPAFWYQKSLNALIRSERIERELNHTYQEVNARRGTPQETFLPAVVYLEAGRTMLRLRQQKEALATFEMGRRLESNPDLLEEMGATYEAFGQWRLAAQTYVEALEVDSNRTRIQEKLVELYGKADPSGCAVNRKGGAPALDLSCPMVHADICGAARNVATNYLRRNQKMYAESIRRTAAVDLGCADELLK